VWEVIFALTHTHTHTHGTTPLDERSASRGDLHMTPQHIRNRQIPMSPAELEPSFRAQEGLQNYAFDRAPTGIGEKEVLAGKTSTSVTLSYTNPKDHLGSNRNAPKVSHIK
jgi:hypothetical protein